MTYVISEVGINHNGDLDLAKFLIKQSHDAGCDAVKFQKRNINEVYSQPNLIIWMSSIIKLHLQWLAMKPLLRL